MKQTHAISYLSAGLFATAAVKLSTVPALADVPIGGGNSSSEIEASFPSSALNQVSDYGVHEFTGTLDETSAVARRLDLYHRIGLVKTTSLGGSGPERNQGACAVTITVDFTLSSNVDLSSVRAWLEESTSWVTASSGSGPSTVNVLRNLPGDEYNDLSGIFWNHNFVVITPPVNTATGRAQLVNRFSYVPKANGFTATYQVRCDALAVRSAPQNSRGWPTARFHFQAYLPQTLDPDPAKRAYTLTITATQSGLSGESQEFPLAPDSPPTGEQSFVDVPDGAFIGTPLALAHRYTAQGGALFEGITLPTGLDADDQFEVFDEDDSLGVFAGGSSIDFASLSGSPVSSFLVKGYSPADPVTQIPEFPVAVDLTTSTATIAAVPLAPPPLDATGLGDTGMVGWTSTPDLEYRFQWSGDLIEWHDLGDWRRGTGGTMSDTDGLPLTGFRFFRVRVR